jgi:hypothetical protein
MRKSRTLLVVFIITTAGLSVLSAQAAAPAAGGNTDARLVAFELGMNGGFKLGAAQPLTIGRSFALNYTLADNFSFGLLNSVSGATTYNLVNLGYFLNPLLGFHIYVGADAAGIAGGAGVSVSVLKSRVDSGLSTALKLRLSYLFDVTAGFGAGDIVLGVSSSIGL